jgi:hypothetical protein
MQLNNNRISVAVRQKQYEVTDHLRNVMITASEKKCAVAKSRDSITTYKPELPSTYDYYSFGMLMPGRYTNDNSISVSIQQIMYPVYSNLCC